MQTVVDGFLTLLDDDTKTGKLTLTRETGRHLTAASQNLGSTLLALPKGLEEWPRPPVFGKWG